MQNLNYEFEERASIVENDANTIKDEAETLAYIELNNRYGLGEDA